ncbi:MAG: hypothetical protein HY340_02980 [Candidatus Kerfeldbacteria bacterium]|nr:hypothetical protein [Candidatus Kerfeldbacteria bacterium]
MPSIYDPTFTQSDLDQLAELRHKRRKMWHDKIVHLNNEIEAGRVKIPLDYPFIKSLAAVKTALDGMIDLATLDATAKSVANAVWDVKARETRAHVPGDASPHRGPLPE